MTRWNVPALLRLRRSAAIAGDARMHAQLDANGHGAIARTEAAARLTLAARFDRRDTDRQGRIAVGERTHHHRGAMPHHAGARDRFGTDRGGRISGVEFESGGTSFAVIGPAPPTPPRLMRTATAASAQPGARGSRSRARGSAEPGETRFEPGSREVDLDRVAASTASKSTGNGPNGPHASRGWKEAATVSRAVSNCCRRRAEPRPGCQPVP